ncbi:IS3 family transposase [Kytococcus sedentarius]|nr:IS3 family transposase [Kytococcus sedentarius]STX14070.1 Integrase core domain [Kytococcus sedentarius]
MTYPLVRDLAADGIPVTVTCRVLKFSPQAFYAWCAHPVSDRDLVDAYAMNAAYEIHAEDPGLGYRFIADELADAGHALSERRVWKICHQGQIVSAHSRTRGRWKKPGPPVPDDLVQRDFTAEAPSRLWLTDITEHPTAEGKLYLCAVKDVWSRRIVGYSINDRMTSQLAVDALEMAIARRGRDTTAGCVVHADRGSQGGFNWSSQHLQCGGGQGWRRWTGAGRPAMCRRGFVDSGVLIGRCARRCVRRAGLSPRVRSSVSSGD